MEVQNSKFGQDAFEPWDQVSLSPPGPWVEELTYERSIPAKSGDHVTNLLWERQVEVELGISFHRTAMRLETGLAVQHQSQWRLDLDLRNQHLSLHWLRVIRGEKTNDQLQRERLRLIQRESQLEHLVIDGQWTLLAVLDDVRPGDIVEAAYSIRQRHPVRPGGCEEFFLVPSQLVTGRFHLSLKFDPARPGMRHLSSSDAPQRQESIVSENRIHWSWDGSQLSPREPELNHPSTCLDCVWIQVSDLLEWQTLAGPLAGVWEASRGSFDVTAHPDFGRPEIVDEKAVHGLVRHIQDNFRYLSVDLGSGGWIPAPPEAVARRRYGDCKDLSWLAATVLGGWGVKARPILVGTGLRESLSGMLPMTLLFNHAILEVEIGGHKRWFDLTSRHQGGDFHGQCVPWFGLGLPVDAGANALDQQPGTPSPSLYALRETILLDTRPGEISTVEVRCWMEGEHADLIRRSHNIQGIGELAKNRLEEARRRFGGKTIRVGELQWRDDRDRNVCEMVESFEINEFLHPDEQGQRAVFDVPLSVVAEFVPLPELKARRTPWAMPYPLEVRHQITLKASSMTPSTRKRWRWNLPEFSGFVEETLRNGAWSKTTCIIYGKPEIEPSRIKECRIQLGDFLVSSTWRIFLPWHRTRQRREPTFGQLPPTSEGVSAYVGPTEISPHRGALSKPPEKKEEPPQTETPPAAPLKTENAPAAPTKPITPVRKARTRTRNRETETVNGIMLFLKIAPFVVTIALYLILKSCN